MTPAGFTISISCAPYVAKYQLQCSSRSLLHSFFSDWITATVSCLDFLLTSSSVSNLFRTLCGSANFWEFDGHNTLHHCSAHQPSLAAHPRTYLPYFKLSVMSYRSIHGTYPSFLQSCFTRVSDMTSRQRLRYSTSDRLDVRPLVCLQSAGGRFRFLVPLSGTTCLSTSHLRCHSRFSDNDSRPFFFSRSYQDTIIWLVCYSHHSSLLSGHLWSLQ